MHSGRVLNDKQHRALDRVAEADPTAIVIGWVQDESGRGPLVLMTDGTEKYAATTGYMNNPR